jgi:hypothetical protein
MALPGGRAANGVAKQRKGIIAPLEEAYDTASPEKTMNTNG